MWVQKSGYLTVHQILAKPVYIKKKKRKNSKTELQVQK